MVMRMIQLIQFVLRVIQRVPCVPVVLLPIVRHVILDGSSLLTSASNAMTHVLHAQEPPLMNAPAPALTPSSKNSPFLVAPHHAQCASTKPLLMSANVVHVQMPNV
jgi:hypothetical protein